MVAGLPKRKHTRQKNKEQVMTDKSLYCSEPYNTLYIEHTNKGKMAPCCAFYPTIDPNEYDTELQKVKEDLHKGVWPTNCVSCKQHEEKKIDSRRLTSGQQKIHPHIKNVEINLGNLCNLKCAICNPKFSSRWLSDAKHFAEFDSNGFYDIPNSSVKDVSKHIDWHSVRYLHFNGGEPLLNNQHLRYLMRVINQDQTEVYYNTNGTTKVSDAVFNIWTNFNRVKLIFSIDDVGQRFEYQRYPAKWKEIENNLLWFKTHAPDNVMFGINRTVSHFNKPYLKDLDEWFEANFGHSKNGIKNEFTNQLAWGPASLQNTREQFVKFVQKLNAVRKISYYEPIE